MVDFLEKRAIVIGKRSFEDSFLRFFYSELIYYEPNKSYLL